MRMMRVLRLNHDNLHKSPESVRQSLRSFIDSKGKLDLKVNRVLQASDLTLVITEWSFSGTGPDGNPVNMWPLPNLQTFLQVIRMMAPGGIKASDIRP